MRLWLLVEKVRALGNFSLCKPGGAAVGGVVEADSFHAESRTLVDSGKADKAAARKVYERSVCLLDAAEAERQVASLLCARITAVREPFRASRVGRGSSRVLCTNSLNLK